MLVLGHPLPPGEAVHAAREAAATAEVDLEAALAWRDFMVSDYSDAGQERWLAVDAHLRVAEHLRAIGDVNGLWPLTHVGKYRGDVVGASILAEPRKANYEAVPRVVYTDPQAAAVGADAGRFSAMVPVSEVAKTHARHPRPPPARRPGRHGQPGRLRGHALVGVAPRRSDRRNMRSMPRHERS